MRTYDSIQTEFRRHFGDAGNFTWCDFRPSRNGNLINVSFAIAPGMPFENTKNIAWLEFQRVWNWLQTWEAYFDADDVLQVVIGFSNQPEPLGTRQIFKGQLEVKSLSKLPNKFSFEMFNQCGGMVRELVKWTSFSKPVAQHNQN